MIAWRIFMSSTPNTNVHSGMFKKSFIVSNVSMIFALWHQSESSMNTTTRFTSSFPRYSEVRLEGRHCVYDFLRLVVEAIQEALDSGVSVIADFPMNFASLRTLAPSLSRFSTSWTSWVSVFPSFTLRRIALISANWISSLPS